MHLLKDLLRSPTIAAVLLVAGLGVVLNSGPSSGTVYKWSTTAATNATADASINWAEGMAPSAVNDSARAMMAAVAKWRNDLAGAIATGGSSTAYTITSNQVFSSLSTMSGQNVCFKPHTTNGATVTLNVDSLGAKALRSAPSVELAAGVLIQDTPYCAVYNNSNSEWVLIGNADLAWSVPIGGMIDYGGTSAPNSNWVIPRGQCLSRTTYAALFALFSTTYPNGSCSGSEFAVPDLGGRVVAGTESSAARLTPGGSGCNGNLLGSTCGAQTVQLVEGNIPSLSSSGFSKSLSLNSNTINGATDILRGGSDITVTQSGSLHVWAGSLQTTLEIQNTGVSGSISYSGSATAVNKQPATIVLTKLLRVL